MSTGAYIMNIRTFASCIIVCLLFAVIKCDIAYSAEAAAEQHKKNTAEGPERDVIEISFGASHLDIDYAFKVKKTDAGDERRYPVTSALFIVEWLAFRTVTVATMLNIPLMPRREISGGTTTERNVATAVGAGLTWIPLSFDAFKRATFECQAGVLGCITFNSTSSHGNYPFPLSFVRFRIVSFKGTAVYIGTSYAVKKDSIALLYGIGHRF
jgi:hypothetical protein